MANKPVAIPLTADLPTDWKYGQTIAPTGAEAGLPEQYGYIYLMEKVNEVRKAVNAVNEAFAALAATGADGKIPSDQLPTVTPGSIGALPEDGTATAAKKLATARTIRTNLSSTGTASFDGTANITPGVTGTLPVTNGGTGNTTGLAASATKLAAARTIRTNLAGTAAAGFDGSKNITPGVTGILPAAHGGTGVDSLDGLISALTGQGMAKIAAGSYKGTGTYGADNPCRLTFDFSPKIVYVMKAIVKDTDRRSMLAIGTDAAMIQSGGYSYASISENAGSVHIAAFDQTVSWYSKSGANGQFNEKESIYRWMAIG